AIAYVHQTNPDFNRLDSKSQSSNTPPHRWINASSPGSGRFDEEKINDAIAYVHQTNTPNFNMPRKVVGP
uniref:Cytochrome cd1 nitrite reductase n=1 Tax=Globodera pallida TaxID=36090 RepID=A0A183CNU2_GLOPA